MLNENYNLISVIIPCFNSGIIINRAINSVNNQTFPEIEILLINDGSDDNETLEILNSYKSFSNIKLINQENLGLSAARNKGALKARGNYLFFLDCDYWIEPRTLELMYAFLKKNKKKVFVFSDIILEGAINKKVQKEYNLFEQLFINQLPYSILISKENWKKNGGYDEKMRDGYEDWDFNIRLGALKIYGMRLDKPLFHYNVSSEGMLLSKSSKLHGKIWKYIMLKNKSLFKFKNIYRIWQEWKNKSSSYPLFIFFLWYLILKYFPEPFITKLFICLRNLKWLFTRNKIFNKL